MSHTVQCITSGRGNPNIMPTECWELTLEEGKVILAAIPEEELTLGSYWRRVFRGAYFRARRFKATFFYVYTAGFSTAEFAQFVTNAGLEYTHTDA